MYSKLQHGTDIPLVEHRDSLSEVGALSVSPPGFSSLLPFPSDLPCQLTRAAPLATTLYKANWRTAALDWLVILALYLPCLFFPTHFPIPERDFDPDDWSISHAHGASTVPYWAVCTASALAVLLMSAYDTLRHRSLPAGYAVLLSFCQGVAINFMFVDLTKVCTGRLRPDFLARCVPDADGTCTGDAALVAQGRLSFPSGHTALAFYAAVFLTLFLYHAFLPKAPGGVFPNGTPITLHISGLSTFLICAPILLASLVGVSRTVDRHHHPGDVVGGLIIGSTMAVLAFTNLLPAARTAYHQKFKSVAAASV
jgi:membrane-associated phospholipid phosphatase